VQPPSRLKNLEASRDVLWTAPRQDPEPAIPSIAPVPWRSATLRNLAATRSRAASHVASRWIPRRPRISGFCSLEEALATFELVGEELGLV